MRELLENVRRALDICANEATFALHELESLEALGGAAQWENKRTRVRTAWGDATLDLGRVLADIEREADEEWQRRQGNEDVEAVEAAKPAKTGHRKASNGPNGKSGKSPRRAVRSK